jgi:GrpB-like predicted nucleotidyltransferase (UPF0157 family)
MIVRVTPPNEDWPNQFDAEAECIATVLGFERRNIHHIGSTSIPGIYAKPVIDMLLVVDAIADLDHGAAAMADIGYSALGEFGIAGRRYFRKDDANGVRTHQVHCFEIGSAEITRHLAFRDYMRAHPAAALAYSELKRHLADLHPDDMPAYMDGKDAFIKLYQAKALDWCFNLNPQLNEAGLLEIGQRDQQLTNQRQKTL